MFPKTSILGDRSKEEQYPQAVGAGHTSFPSVSDEANGGKSQKLIKEQRDRACLRKISGGVAYVVVKHATNEYQKVGRTQDSPILGDVVRHLPCTRHATCNMQHAIH